MFFAMGAEIGGQKMSENLQNGPERTDTTTITCGSLTCFIAIQIVSQTDLIGPGSGLLLSIV